MIAPPNLILAPYLATPADVVEHMLDMAGVGTDDCVHDLGCGDGRVVIAAARRGAKGVGIDCEPWWVDQARAAAAAAGVADRVRFDVGDAMAMDPSSATVVFLYLVEWSTQRMCERLAALCKPGTRVLSHSFGFTSLAAAVSETFMDASGQPRRLHMWQVAEARDPAAG